MGNEYYGAPTTPTSDYLAHYGIKGMKWGVRKARESGNARALGRQYRKAEKKLAKLERRAASGKKYAKRAALLGAGAAAAGGLAAVGTAGVSKGIGAAGNAFSQGAKGAGGLMQRGGQWMTNRGIRGGGRVAAAGKAVSGLGKHNASGIANAVDTWGKGTDVGKNVAKGIKGAGIKANQIVGGRGVNSIGSRANTLANKARGVSNSGYARLASAGVGAGLLAGAGYNAYRAASTKRAARQAAQFRKEMNKAFAGTQYANGGGSKKRRRR